MSEIDKMFEKLGYKNITKDSASLIIYMNEKEDVAIRFWNDKTVDKIDVNGKLNAIIMQELQAIYKKCEEMRMDIMDIVDIEEAKNWLAGIATHTIEQERGQALTLRILEKFSKELKETKDNEYAANNIISDLLDVMRIIEIESNKKDRIIDMMAELLTKMPFYDNSGENIIMLNNKEEVIKYFKEKVEEENKNG